MNSSQLSQFTVKLGNVKDENGRNHLPDCVQTENGVLLTDLGRKQVSPASLPSVCKCPILQNVWLHGGSVLTVGAEISPRDVWTAGWL